MPNNWSSFETDEVSGWEAEFGWRVPPEALLRWQQVLFSAGERHGIFRVDEAPFLDFRRDRDGPIARFLIEHPERVPRHDLRLPPGFLPESLGPRPDGAAVTATLLEFFGTDGTLQQAWIGELSEAYPVIPLPRYFPYPAIEVTADTGPPSQPDIDKLWVDVTTSVDIWFPWNSPVHHPETREPLDNRALSRLNGTRLNAFLGELREATVAAGGSWHLSTPDDPAHPRADGNGVLLDAPRPASD